MTKDKSDKYKDLLCAILSLVTVDFILGSFVESRNHLKACTTLITARQIKRPKISRKAQSLHRIAGFLKILQDSTNMDFNDMESFQNKDVSNWIDLDFEIYLTDNNQLDSNIIFDHMTSSDYWNKYSDIVGFSALPEEFYSKELTLTFEIYGIPDSLILIFSQVTNIARNVLMYRINGQSIPECLIHQCTELELTLMTWKNRYTANESHIPFHGDQKRVMIAHMQAFHRALFIYYVRIAKSVDTKLITGEVQEILEHLEDIQQVNSKYPKPLAVPLVFPAFIGACEIDFNNPNGEELRSRYEAWFGQMFVEGLGTYSAAREVLKQVWERRSRRRENCNWWDLLRKRNINLMLC